MINRRQVMQRDPPYDFVAALRRIRDITGWGTSDLAFVLVLPRSTVWQIECQGSRPNVDDGDAIRKLLAEIEAAAIAHEAAQRATAHRQATCDAAYRPCRLHGTHVVL